MATGIFNQPGLASGAPLIRIADVMHAASETSRPLARGFTLALRASRMERIGHGVVTLVCHGGASPTVSVSMKARLL
jgi:hypothetical protein